MKLSFSAFFSTKTVVCAITARLPPKVVPVRETKRETKTNLHLYIFFNNNTGTYIQYQVELNSTDKSNVFLIRNPCYQNQAWQQTIFCIINPYRGNHKRVHMEKINFCYCKINDIQTFMPNLLKDYSLMLKDTKELERRKLPHN